MSVCSETSIIVLMSFDLLHCTDEKDLKKDKLKTHSAFITDSRHTGNKTMHAREAMHKALPSSASEKTQSGQLRLGNRSLKVTFSVRKKPGICSHTHPPR